MDEGSADYCCSEVGEIIMSRITSYYINFNIHYNEFAISIITARNPVGRNNNNIGVVSCRCLVLGAPRDCEDIV